MRGRRADTVIECEGGYFAGGWAYDYDDKKIKQFKVSGGGSHHQNFIKAVRSRKVSDLNADILDGYLSTVLCHMGNISYRIGRTTSPDKIAQSTGSKVYLLDAFERAAEHLSLHDVDLKKTPMTLGPWLTMDSGMGRFTGELSNEVNMYLTRNYRAPFTVPAEV